jgi:hypothetical protein
MKKIPLTQGLFAIVDDEDFERLSKFKWHATINPSTGKFQARRRNKSQHVYMQCEIVSRTIGKQIDHRNGDSLDNQKENLRLCSASQNCCNRRMKQFNTSGFKGVEKKGKKFCARIKAGMNHIWIGTFKTSIEAARAYNEAAKKYHGEFARLNPV